MVRRRMRERMMRVVLRPVNDDSEIQMYTDLYDNQLPCALRSLSFLNLRQERRTV
jgi:hypothetical protein